MYYFNEPNTKPLAIAATVCFILLIACLVWFALAPSTMVQQKVYPLTAKVVEVDRDADVVTCVDGAGRLWGFTECDDWCEGDFVSLLMCDHGTPDNVLDDIITMVRYGGYFEE